MKKNAVKNEFAKTISKKELATLGVAKSNAAEKKELQNERKTLRACIQYISVAESKAAELWRAFFKLKKGASKKDREALLNTLNNNAPYISDIWSVDSDGVCYCQRLPVRSNGKKYVDYLLFLSDYKKAYEKSSEERSYIARKMQIARKAMYEKGLEYYKENLHVVQGYSKNAPGKIKQKYFKMMPFNEE